MNYEQLYDAYERAQDEIERLEADLDRQRRAANEYHAQCDDWRRRWRAAQGDL